MARRLSVLIFLVVLLPLLGGTAAAQDAKTVLQAVSKAMGVDNLKCITYSGTGSLGLVGQNWDPESDWPKIELGSYTKTLNFDGKAAREESVRRQGTFPARGGGGMPIAGEQRVIAIVNGNYAWNMQGTNAQPAPAAAEQRQLDIWLTPPGFVKGAMAATNVVAFSRFEGGLDANFNEAVPRKLSIVSFTALGKYRVTATINDQNLIERIQTTVPNPVLGDMNYETMYSDYKDFGGVKFPTRFHHHDAWDDNERKPNISGGHNGFDLAVKDVQPNACADPLTVPDAVRTATVPPVRVETQKLADGVYFLGGGSHNSVLVEFKDFVAVIEGPLNEARSLAVIDEVHKLVPNKRIRYLVNTHQHYDHLGGVRTYAWEGATIVTYEGNRDFYMLEVLSHAPFTLQPDRLYLYPPEELDEGYVLELVNERYVLSDGTRNLEIHKMQGLAHADGMLIAYLPKEKIAVEADMFNPPPANAPLPTTAGASEKTFYNNVQRLKLDISTIAPIHGRVTPWADFLKVIGSAAKTN